MDKEQDQLKRQLQNVNDKTKNIKKMMEKGKDSIIITLSSRYIQFGKADSEFPYMIPFSLVKKSMYNSNPNQKETNCNTMINLLKNKDKNEEELNKRLEEIYSKLETERKELLDLGFLHLERKSDEDSEFVNEQTIIDDKFSNYQFFRKMCEEFSQNDFEIEEEKEEQNNLNQIDKIEEEEYNFQKMTKNNTPLQLSEILKYPIQDIVTNNLKELNVFKEMSQEKQNEIFNETYEDKHITNFTDCYSDSKLTDDQIFIEPFLHPNFNVSMNYSEEDVLKDFMNIFIFILKCLKIDLNKCGDYQVVLVVPNDFNRKHFEKLIDCIIKKFMFKGLSIQLQSVMTAFGAGSPLCYHTHFDWTTSFCTIIEEGIFKYKININWGIKDIIDLLLFYIMMKRNLDLSPYFTYQVFELIFLKYSSFGMNFEEKDQIPLKLFNYQTKTWDVVILHKSDLVVVLNSIFIDSVFLNKNQNSIQKTILSELEKINDQAYKKKLAVSISVTGLISSVPKMIDLFEENLIRYVDRNNLSLLEIMVIDSLTIRNIPPINLSWVGASILPKLESFDEVMFTSHQYLGKL